MVQLFLSCVCDYCERKPNYDGYYRGWVVWRDQVGFPHYVFSNQWSAERWRRGQGRPDGELRLILCSEPFIWRSSRSPIRDIELADHLFEVFVDHRFKLAPYRAFLAPLEMQHLYESR